MIEQNKEMFDLGVKVIAFSFAEANSDMDDLNDIYIEKDALIEEFKKVMVITEEEFTKMKP